MKKRVIKTAGLLLLAAFANPLIAETDYSSGWYLGGNIGMSTANIDEEKITQNITTTSYSDDDRDLGYKLFGGYQFNENFALEGGYFNLGEFGYGLTTPTGTANGNIKVMGLNLDAVAILPLAEDFSVFARAGAHYSQSKDAFNATGSIAVTDPDPKKSDLNYKFGVGLEYAITDAVGLRLEAERYRVNDAVGNDGDIDLFSVGLSYRFGETTKAPPVSKQKKAPAPSAVEEEEVLVIVTEPQAEKKIKESVTRKKIVILVFEDIHFDFDKSTLSKATKAALKKDVAHLKGNNQIRMIVSGHTSRMGTKGYNQDLSERRGQSVKDYLVKEKLIAADKVSVIGYGETKPLINEARPKNIHSKAAKANMRAYIKIIYE